MKRQILTTLWCLLALALMCAPAMTSPGATDTSTSSTMAPAAMQATGAKMKVAAADTGSGAYEAANIAKENNKVKSPLKVMVAQAIPLNADGVKMFARKALVRSTELAAADTAAGHQCAAANKTSAAGTQAQDTTEHLTAAAISPAAAQARNNILKA